jgi:hypothetical protein
MTHKSAKIRRWVSKQNESNPINDEQVCIKERQLEMSIAAKHQAIIKVLFICKGESLGVE